LPEQEDLLARWFQREITNGLAFDVAAFRSAAALFGLFEKSGSNPKGSYQLHLNDGLCVAIDAYLSETEKRVISVESLAAALLALRSLCTSGTETPLLDGYRDVARAMEISRRETVCDAARGALRMSFETAVPGAVRRLWPLAVPAKRIRLQRHCAFFEHSRLDMAALCFQEPTDIDEIETEEWVMVCYAGGESFGIGKTQTRQRTDSRARVLCTLVARTVVSPAEVRGSLFWKSCADTLKDVSVFPRLSDNAEEDARRARAAVDSIGYTRALAAVWMGQDEAG
jgi:hypothetical protein